MLPFDVLESVKEVEAYEDLMDGYMGTGDWGSDYRHAYPAIVFIDWDYRTALWIESAPMCDYWGVDWSIPSDLGADDAMARFRSMTSESWTAPNPFLAVDGDYTLTEWYRHSVIYSIPSHQ